MYLADFHAMPPAIASDVPPRSTTSSPDFSGIRSLDSIKAFVNSTVRIRPPHSLRPRPIESLRRGDWVKLICGASFEDAADIRNLSLVYALAGVDCIDCAADESIVTAVNDGIDAAVMISSIERPWVMISVNDDKADLHFRKAGDATPKEFDPEDCPLDCSRPCEKICPANAIVLEYSLTGNSNTYQGLQGGVVTERCYGCGRCFPICPYDKIRAKTYIRDPVATGELLLRNDVDAIEIHTTGTCTDLFSELWDSLGNSIKHVKLVAVSTPDIGNLTFTKMNTMYMIMKPHLMGYNLWQLDGRPMSGDIGRGATRKAIDFAISLAAISERPHGFYQLAGGTNLYTVERLKKVGLFQATKPSGAAGLVDSEEALIGGIAYGSFARKIVGRIFQKIPSHGGSVLIEDHPMLLMEALWEALVLLAPIKSYNIPMGCPQLD